MEDDGKEIRHNEMEETIPPVTFSTSSSSEDDNDDGPGLEEKPSAITADTTSPSSSPSIESPTTTSVPPPASPPRISNGSINKSPHISPAGSPSANHTTTAASNRPPIHLHPSNLNTPQMMVLGKDGSDYRDLMTPRTIDRQQALLEEESKVEHMALESVEEQTYSSSSSSWWNRLWQGEKPARGGSSSPSSRYTSMEDGAGPNNLPISSSPRKRRPQPQPQQQQQQQQQQASDVETPMYHQGQDEDPLHSPPPSQQRAQQMQHRSILSNLPLPSNKEEQLQQDCSFLYRAVDESPRVASRSNRPTLRAILDPPPAGVSTLYRDAQAILSPPVMAEYKAKYQQLNQDFEPSHHYDDDRFADYEDFSLAPHDLTLEEQAANPNPHNNLAVITQTVAQSSLFYEDESNGRILLTLPRDRVRLLVAGELESGILSVVQCRRPEDPPTNQLEYCLTVPANLYQKVVSEMRHVKANHNQHHHIVGSGNDHADIRWAVGIMVVILIILGINTLVFGLD